MKFDKLIELLKEMETTIEAEENQTLLEKLNREEMINTMQFLQRCAAQAGIIIICRHPAVNLVL